MSFKNSEYVFDSITLENLTKMATQEGIEIPSEKKPKKADYVAELAFVAETHGVRQVTSTFTIEQLEDISKAMKLKFDGQNANLKVVHKKRIQEKMAETGAAEFMEAILDADQVKYFIEAFGEQPVSDKKKDLIVQAVGLVQMAGTEIFLSKFDVPFLKDVIIRDLKLKCSTDSKNKIIRGIVTGTSAKTERQERDIEFSKEKKTIKKGISYQDIFQHYYVDEVQDYCKENGLKVSGTKPEIIKRIIAFLDGDTENTLAKQVEKPKAKTAEKEKPVAKKNEKEGKNESKEESESEEEAEKPVEKVVTPVKEKNEKSPKETKGKVAKAPTKVKA